MDNFDKISSSDYILDSSREYSIYVCENRAIPKVTDGLKDGQRKALWLMRTKGDKIKTISLAGEMISSELYLHGDQSAAGTVSMLAAPFCNNVPLLNGVGNFGTRVSPVDGIGAPRYTYVKRGKAAEKLLYQDLDIVPLKDNHDGSNKEPITFLPIIPTVLLNGVSGIAVGWSTEILPRSLDDLISATLTVIDGKKLKRIEPKYTYLNCNAKYLGDNSWEFTGKIEIVDSSTVRVTELPPDLTLEKFKVRLVKFEEELKINDWTDRSTKNINVEIKMKRGSVKDWTEEDAINYFKLRTKITERIVVIDWGGKAIKQYDNAEVLVEDFVKWRFNLYIERYKKLLIDTDYELKYWLAVKQCFDSDLPSKLMKMKDKKEIETNVLNITKSIGIDDKQVDKISSLPTYKWAKDAYQECLEKIKHLQDLQKEYTRLLSKPDEIKKIYRSEVEDLKKEKFKGI